jgi:hypothetical protein
MSVQISYARPNPIGKDKTPSGTAKAEQLLGEWVDITNIGTEGIRISTLGVHHTRFDDYCRVRPESTEEYWSWRDSKEILQSGQTIRVYTGRHKDLHLLASMPVDNGSVAWHGFANRDNFVLNNRCGDTIYVTWNDSRGQQQDSAGYANNPPEGRILKRVGTRLLPV